MGKRQPDLPSTLHLSIRNWWVGRAGQLVLRFTAKIHVARKRGALPDGVRSNRRPWPTRQGVSANTRHSHPRRSSEPVRGWKGLGNVDSRGPLHSAGEQESHLVGGRASMEGLSSRDQTLSRRERDRARMVFEREGIRRQRLAQRAQEIERLEENSF